jgi:hypothetical protein
MFCSVSFQKLLSRAVRQFSITEEEQYDADRGRQHFSVEALLSHHSARDGRSHVLAGKPPVLLPTHDGDVARLRGAAALALALSEARNLRAHTFAA